MGAPAHLEIGRAHFVLAFCIIALIPFVWRCHLLTLVWKGVLCPFHHLSDDVLLLLHMTHAIAIFPSQLDVFDFDWILLRAHKASLLLHRLDHDLARRWITALVETFAWAFTTSGSPSQPWLLWILTRIWFHNGRHLIFIYRRIIIFYRCRLSLLKYRFRVVFGWRRWYFRAVALVVLRNLTWTVFDVVIEGVLVLDRVVKAPFADLFVV